MKVEAKDKGGMNSLSSLDACLYRAHGVLITPFLTVTWPTTVPCLPVH